MGDLQVQFQVWIADIELGRNVVNSGVKLNRRLPFDALMWSEFVIPGEIEPKLKSQVGLSQRDKNTTGAFGFQGADHTLNDGNGAVFADGPEAGLDVPASAPAFEGLAPELTAFVRDDVFGSLTGSVNGAAEEGPDLEGIGLVVKDGKADDLPGEMVNNHGNPITERPALRQGER